MPRASPRPCAKLAGPWLCTYHPHPAGSHCGSLPTVGTQAQDVPACGERAVLKLCFCTAKVLSSGKFRTSRQSAPSSQGLAEAAPLSPASQALGALWGVGQGAGEGGSRKTCVMDQSGEVGVDLSLPVESHCADAGVSRKNQII